MRTTATIEPEVERLLNQVMKERGVSFKKALNDALRAGLAPARGVAKPFVQKTYSLGPAHDFRLEKALAVSDALEDEELVRKLRRRK